MGGIRNVLDGGDGQHGGRSANGTRERADCGQGTEVPDSALLEAPEELGWKMEPGCASIKP